MAIVIARILRIALAAAGGGGVLMSDDELTQVASALATVIALGWEAYARYKRKRAEQAPPAAV
jgi:uncharacterized membrane protein YebE (DUF533 family)